jgi:hypothetical protein
MPKEAEYTITWSDTLQGYEILHAPFRFPVASTETLLHWLSMVSSVHFCSRTAHTLTLRKERKQRGAGYWYAYKRVQGVLKKRYLGPTDQLNIQLLETVARTFAEPEPVKPPPKQPTLKFTKTLESALRIYGFAAIPTHRALTDRYRELSKRHHPDRGGIHEDMVAVNLAYDYLKKLINDSR